MGRVWASTRADSNGKRVPDPLSPPTSGGISAALSTPAAKTSIETLTVKGGILAGGYGLGKVLNLPLLQSAASGAAEFVGSAGSLGTGIATAIDARARYVCGN